MASLVQDTAFSNLVRLVSGGRLFRFPDEADPELWKKYVNEKKSGYAAHHGNTQPHGDESDTEEWQNAALGGVRTRDAARGSDFSGQTQVDQGVNEASGMKVDPEKGRDVHIVDFIENDPEVSFTLYDG